MPDGDRFLVPTPIMTVHPRSHPTTPDAFGPGIVSPAERERWLAILRGNRGFAHPERWVDYARHYGFARVAARAVETCPYCHGARARVLGQYIYYSTLHHLRTCEGCGLTYTDTRIDPALVAEHFERTYKDESYFAERRRLAFAQIAEVIAARAPHGASVLDVGGAKGHLMAMVRARRPDLRITVNDLSASACDWARERFGFGTIVGSIPSLATSGRTFDVVVMSDVLYYEPALREAWSAMSALVAPGGTLVLRMPNKLPLMRAWQTAQRWLRPAARRELDGRIRFFNPEHLYVFSRGFLERALIAAGFERVGFAPAAALVPRGRRALAVRAAHVVARLAAGVSFGRLVVAPSFLTIATRARSAAADA